MHWSWLDLFEIWSLFNFKDYYSKENYVLEPIETFKNMIFVLNSKNITARKYAPELIGSFWTTILVLTPKIWFLLVHIFGVRTEWIGTFWNYDRIWNFLFYFCLHFRIQNNFLFLQEAEWSCNTYQYIYQKHETRSLLV